MFAEVINSKTKNEAYTCYNACIPSTGYTKDRHFFRALLCERECEDGIRCTCSTLYGKFSTFAFWYIGAEKQAICLYVHEMI